MSISGFFKRKEEQQAESSSKTNPGVNESKKKAQGEEFLRAADEAYRNQNYTLLISCLERAAECGSRDAKVELGILALKSDPQRAQRLFLEAAQNGDAKAAHNLGVMFRDGKGINQDDAKAFYWFERGAQLGSVRSLNSLGLRYKNGLGVARDYKKAHDLFTEADRKGDADAGFNLAIMYIVGMGVEQNECTAIYWLQRSASHGHRDAAEALRDNPTKYLHNYFVSHLRVRPPDCAPCGFRGEG